MSAFSVGESGLKSSQDSNRLMFFIFFHPKFKLQEFLARRLFVCSKQILATDLCCRATRWVGKNRWDRIGWRRNQGLPARHSPDGAAVHFRGLPSTNRGSRELERLEGRLGSGRGILSRQLPTIVFLWIDLTLRPVVGTGERMCSSLLLVPYTCYSYSVSRKHSLGKWWKKQIGRTRVCIKKTCKLFI